MNKVIALDAGHGVNAVGKRCLKSLDANQTREWWLNGRIADMVQERLGAYKCKVLRVDDAAGLKDVSLSARVKSANAAKADIYVSIHHNAGIYGGRGGGVCVYYYGAGRADGQDKAGRLYDAVVSRNNLTGNRSRKIVPSSGLYVLKYRKMPALLLENGFMDSQVDTPIILTQAHADATACGIEDFLVEELKLVKK